jgi:hypothetical protein
MKPNRKLLGHNPFIDALYRNPGMMLNKQGLGHRIFSDALHRYLGVVKNKQGSSHLSRRMRKVRKLAEPSRVRIVTWNVGSLTGKL